MGLDDLPADCLAFHAGTRLENDQIVTAGGRVLGLTCLKPTLAEAIDSVYAAAEKVTFENMHYRSDIGKTLGK